MSGFVGEGIVTVGDINESIGKPLPPSRVVVERGPVSNFAAAVTDKSPVYHDPEAATAAGFDAIPAPPTWPFAMENWGKYPEIQPDGSSDKSPIMAAIGALMQSGGLILHGEQEFIYHRPIQVGDELTSEGVIEDIYVKEGKSKMTFVVTRNDWKDANGEPVVTAKMTLLHKA